MTPRVRKAALTVHMTASVGWLGAVVVFLALAVAGVSAADSVAAAAYVVMDALAWSVLVPLALLALVTGVVQAMGTPWGLVRHYWVLLKLVLTAAATGVLVLYSATLEALAEAAAAGHLTRSASPVLHAGAALVVLLTVVVVSMYKPKGLTPYGWRRETQQRAALVSGLPR